MAKKQVTFADLHILTHPMDAEDDDIMLPVDMRGLGIEIDDVDDIVEILGPNGAVGAFVKARRYFEENQGGDPEEERASSMSGKDFKKMMLDDMHDQGEENEADAEPLPKKAKSA